jgi:hypothetical protein
MGVRRHLRLIRKVGLMLVGLWCAQCRKPGGDHGTMRRQRHKFTGRTSAIEEPMFPG